MKKIYTKSVFEFNKKTGLYEVNQSESEFHYIDDNSPMINMKGGGGSSGGSVTESQDPWGPQQPYLEAGFGAAKTGFLDIPNNLPISAETQQALNMISNRATSGSPLNDQATGLLSRTINGDYLYGGEGFNKAYDAAKNTIIPDVQGSFERYGRGGSGLAATAETGALGDAFAKQYETERGYQQEAMKMAPQFANLPYEDAAKLLGVGTEREQLSMQDRLSRQQAIKDYIALIQGNYGGLKTDPGAAPLSWRERLLNSLGGGLSGAATGFEASGGNPMGAAAGSVGGGVLGYLNG